MISGLQCSIDAPLDSQYNVSFAVAYGPSPIPEVTPGPTCCRFVWVVQFFARNGFTVLIDNHLREDSTVLEQPQRWLQVRGHRLAAAVVKFGGLHCLLGRQSLLDWAHVMWLHFLKLLVVSWHPDRERNFTWSVRCEANQVI